MLQIYCLGAPQLTLSTTAFQPTLTPKAMALFVYLAVTQQTHSRDQLADLLWSETNNQKARTNLRYLLPEVRQPFGEYLVITPQTIAFQRQAPYWLDVEQLRSTLTARPESIATPALQAALDLYQEEFLAGFSVRNTPVFEAWVTRQREEVHTLVVQGGYTLAERYWQQADYQPGLAATQRLLQWEPWHEAGHRLQMQLLAAGGQRAAALTQYERCRTILAAELGVEPEAATTALYEQIRSSVYDKACPGRMTGWQDDKVTSDKVTSDKVTTSHPLTHSPSHLVTLSPPPHNLPHQLTTFIGRAGEIEYLCTLLANPVHRLVTLTGLGGIGKTRLALVVGQRLSEMLKFPDGAWFVPLISIAEGENLTDQLALAVLTALQLPLAGPVAPLEQLLDALRDRRLLLILDNFEHLPTGGDFLLTLLRRAQGVQLLVTSRLSLDLQAEVVGALEGLATPELGAPLTPTLAEALLYDSVALFVERAQHADRTFRLDQTNYPVILQICRFVEGLPLGIELAATMLRYSSCSDLWQNLLQDYRTLGAMQRDRAPRHRSITALFDYSWRLLTPTQAHTWAACTLFPQPFTLAAALAIAATTEENVFALVDHSLLRRTADGRFTLHELVRQYGAEQLHRDPLAVAQARQRHAAYYAALIEPDVAELLRSPAKFQSIQQELPNLRLTWLWAIEQQQLWPLLPIGQGLFVYFIAQGPVQEGWELCALAIDLLHHWPPATLTVDELRLWARALACQSYLSYFLGRNDECVQFAQEAMTRAQPLADALATGLAASALGMNAMIQGDFAAQERLFRHALAAARTGSLPYLGVIALSNLGLVLTLQNQISAALAALHEALQLMREDRLVLLEGLVLTYLSLAYATTGDWALAGDTTQQALQVGQALNNSLQRGVHYRQLALTAEALGDYARAVAWTEEALTVSTLVPDPMNQLQVLLVRSRVLRHSGKLTEAEDACQQLLALAQRLAQPAESAQAQLELGHVALAGQAWQSAELYYRAALASSASVPAVAATALAALAWLHWQCNGLVEAQSWAAESYTTLLSRPLEQQYDAAYGALLCYQVLLAAQDSRAATLLIHTHSWLTTQAQKISDDTLRQAFLHNVAAHRQLQEAAHGVMA